MLKLLDGKKFNPKNLLISKLSRKITILFIIVGFISSSFAVYYFYTVTIKITPEILTSETTILLRNSAIVIVVLIALNAGVIGFLFSKSISTPLKKLYKATKKVEKGNYNVHLEIFTGDEIQELSNAFNQTILTLAKMQEKRKEIDNAKTEFLSITSHELRSPVTPMKAQLQMLEEGYFGKLSDEQKESIRIVTRNTDRLDKIIADFLEISRIEAASLKFNFRETDIAQLLKEIVQFMYGVAKEKNIKLELDVKKLPIIEADPDRISQVLRNLINNAIKFSYEKSRIKISAKLKKNHILFSVRDHGCGLTPDNQIRIFEPFYQVEDTDGSRNDGTGLGLAICKGIVESQKGKIWVESKPDAGSKFYFTLPLCPLREIEPIKVLFFQKYKVEKKMHEKFQTALKPFEIEEFEGFKIGLTKLSKKRKNKKTILFPNKTYKKIKDEKWSEREFDSVFIFDENANILDCNNQMYKKLGYTKSELKNLNMSDIDALESKKDILEKIKKVKKDGVLTFKTIHKRKDGSKLLVDENLQYLKEKNEFKGIAREDCFLKKI